MKNLIKNPYFIGFLLVLLVFYAFSFGFSGEKIDYNTQVKPILNKKCIACHGGVKRESEFSLLFRQDALAPAKSGKPAIIPGNAKASEFIKRLNHHDPEERMPYKQPPLSKNEIDILTRWVDQGAEWGDHWAYLPVQKQEVPKPKGAFFGLLPAKKIDWVKNDIDYFIYDKLLKEKLTPSVEADKLTLLRRVSLDITGLPPSENIKNQYLTDNSPNAYENLVDSLLASLQYGERWTAMWLDLARYADTKGYERDDSRRIWRYRDWLIKAFNQNKPYDVFLKEQIAGDLLPNPSDENYIATAFHRNTMTNDEGGTDNEEFRTAAVIDRVNTTWEMLMGTSFGCVQCHSHPYDPFRHEEYYKFLAFFNNSRDEDTEADYPLLREYKKQDSLKFLEIQGWLKSNMPDRANELTIFLKTLHPILNSLTADDFINAELLDTKWAVLRKDGSARIKNVDFTGKNKMIFPFSSRVPGGTLTLTIDSLKGQVLKILPLDTSGQLQYAYIDIPAVTGKHNLYLRYTNPKMKLFTQNGISFDWFHLTKNWEKDDPVVYKKFKELIQSKDLETTPIMMENPPEMARTTHVFERGNWLVKGDEVQPDVPKSLNPFPKDAPRNRLGLAAWLTDKQNPLTARTFVNRIWEQIFGQGLVETLEDMGTQGIPPTHRELLDYLSYQFIHEYNWDIKKLVKTMVMSATYRQDSKVTAVMQEKDPFNKYYARAPRVRLSAEQIRDQALAVSGLLSYKMYGKSVFPYQPKGIWSSPWNGADWKQDTGDNQYRRSLYTYWKRSSPYPAMMTFDGVNREICVARRIRTNTPLQALVTLNDSTYMVAALEIAKKAASTEGGIIPAIAKCYESVLYKSINGDNSEVLLKLYNTSLNHFNKKEKTDKKMDAMLLKQKPEVAALAVVVNAIMNLDEFLNKS